MSGFPDLDLFLGAMLVGTAFVCALAALWIVARLTPARHVSWAPLASTGDATAFLFEDERLVDATPEARALLAGGPEQMEDFPRLAAVLAPRFPDLAARLARLGPEQALELVSEDGRTALAAEWRAGLTRIALRHAGAAPGPGPDSLSLAALQDELADLRATVDAAPILVWKEDAGGAVRWANAAYLELAMRTDPEAETLTWPLPRLFPPGAERAQGDERADPGERPLHFAVATTGPDGQEERHAFDITEKRLGDAVMGFAAPADRLVHAETQLKEFVQTLTKTFAHLPIGLAVFDRTRRLAVFNPALTDLCGLAPLFLSRRPTLFDFLDALREVRRMPEPKDYREWRRRIVEMEEAAAHGTHIETWTLPDGQTFRVTGRPHPDGAIAFLFQDITSEVSLTRRFRSELELGQAVVDCLPEAIAVFGPSRGLVLSNAAYDALWSADGADPATAPLRATSLAEALAVWGAGASPSPVWNEVAAFAGRTGHEPGWTREVRLRDGRGLTVRVAPLPGKAMLVGFAPVSEDARLLAPVGSSGAANLSGADLSGANLSGADLSGADLSEAGVASGAAIVSGTAGASAADDLRGMAEGSRPTTAAATISGVTKAQGPAPGPAGPDNSASMELAAPQAEGPLVGRSARAPDAAAPDPALQGAATVGAAMSAARARAADERREDVAAGPVPEEAPRPATARKAQG